MLLRNFIIGVVLIYVTAEHSFDSTKVLLYANQKFSTINAKLAQHTDLIRNHSERVKTTSKLVKEALAGIADEPKQNYAIDQFYRRSMRCLCSHTQSGIIDDATDCYDGIQDLQTVNAEKRMRRDFNSTAAIYFYVVMASTELSPSRHHLLHFDQVKFNQGGAYDKYIGTFIVPLAGTYTFTWSISVGRLTSYVICTNLIVNDSVYGTLYTDPYHTYEKDSNFVVAHVNTGDVVFVRTCTSPFTSGSILSDSDLHSSYFAGWLI